MAVQSITLHLPDDLYQRIKDAAQQTHRTVEEELLDVIAAAAPTPAILPDDLTAALNDLVALSDTDLWQVARSKLPARESVRMEALHLKRQREGLSEDETQELSRLVARYERFMLVHARAAALLHERGYDVSQLGPRQ